jgi:probable rRNA maturation factor
MIVNRQRRVRVSVQGLEKFLELARKRLRVSAEALTVCLVSDSEMARWNSVHRGKKGPTDVLSFSTNGPEPHRPKRKSRAQRKGSTSTSAASFRDAFTNPPYLGDIAIAPAVARRNARKFSRSFDTEMRILILHGMLHLMGYDHETDAGQMERRERRLRRELGLA